eukprot:TRINITY_DN1761_c0_g1_i1.p1 TRINITY_DN1761_c0_g1~~TRINITY_DN1761_c0_g1_i1.p1  ORF type:complete len:225 (-),score=46.80 TRINITY_DN1761_c0_g1_i1:134-808(-)
MISAKNIPLLLVVSCFACVCLSQQPPDPSTVCWGSNWLAGFITTQMATEKNTTTVTNIMGQIYVGGARFRQEYVLYDDDANEGNFTLVVDSDAMKGYLVTKGNTCTVIKMPPGSGMKSCLDKTFKFIKSVNLAGASVNVWLSSTATAVTEVFLAQGTNIPMQEVVHITEQSGVTLNTNTQLFNFEPVRVDPALFNIPRQCPQQQDMMMMSMTMAHREVFVPLFM